LGCFLYFGNNKYIKYAFELANNMHLVSSKVTEIYEASYGVQL